MSWPLYCVDQCLSFCRVAAKPRAVGLLLAVTSPSAPFGAIGGPGLFALSALRKNSLSSFVALLRQLSQASLRTQDAIRLRLLVHPAGPQGRTAQATCPDCEEQSNRTRLFFVVRCVETHNTSTVSLRARPAIHATPEIR